MNRDDLLRKLSERFHLRRSFVKKIIGLAWEEIIKELAADKRVCLHELGVFKPVIYPPRKWYNPITKKIETLPSHRSIKFKPSKSVLKKLAKSKQ
jgi:nucleoid DNA-binding protein